MPTIFSACGSTRGFQDADHNIVHLMQGGLGMPGRDDYLDPSSKMVELRVQYQAHIARVLKLAGIADAESRAASTWMSPQTRQKALAKLAVY
jgi:predicted metalloendopeptidase